MNQIIKALLLLLCAVSTPLCYAQKDFPPEFEQLEAYIRCASERDPDKCRFQLPERFDTPFARAVRGFTVWLGGYKPGVDEYQFALKDFQWAADKGYFPAYEGMVMVNSRKDPRIALAWMKKATESGMSPYGNYIISPQQPVSETLTLEEDLVYRCIAFHPAAIEFTDFLREIWEIKRLTIPDAEGLKKRLLEVLDERAIRRREIYPGACAANHPFFWNSPPDVMKEKKERVRKRVSQALEGIRQQLVRYP